MSYSSRVFSENKRNIKKRNIDAIIFLYELTWYIKRFKERNGRILPSTYQKINKFGHSIIFGSGSHCFFARRNNGQDSD